MGESAESAESARQKNIWPDWPNWPDWPFGVKRSKRSKRSEQKNDKTKNHMTKLCGERGVAKPINYADSVYTLRSKRSPAHILSRTPSRKNGSERVYTVSLAERWASSVLERRAIILPW